MKVKRIVPDFLVDDPARAHAFYGRVLGLDALMDMGWIATYGRPGEKSVQVTFLTEGGAGAAAPDLSVEVDDLEVALSRARDAGFAIEYGPVTEPWGVRRFFVRDPFGKLVNVLQHV
ncbi:MAG: VOC family protein [Sandaracinaceae bacterium]